MPVLKLNEKSTNRLPLEPIKDSEGDYMFGGATPAKLVAVEVIETEKFEKGEFAGFAVPKLVFRFENHKILTHERDKFIDHMESVVSTKKKVVIGNEETYEDMPEATILKMVTDQWKRIKALVQGFHYSKEVTPNYREIEAIGEKEAKVLDNIALIKGTPDKRIAAYKALFSMIATFANGDGKEVKPIFTGKNDKPLSLFIKLLPEYNNGTFYTFPNFTGRGLIEVMIWDNNKIVAPQVIKFSPNESLELRAKKSRKSQISKDTPGGVDDEIDEDVKKLL